MSEISTTSFTSSPDQINFKKIPLPEQSFKQLIDQNSSINWNLEWLDSTIYYSFDTNNLLLESNYPPVTFNGSQINAVNTILNQVTQITGIHFTETKNANIVNFHFAAFNLPESYSLTTSYPIEKGNIFISLHNPDSANANKGTPGYSSLLKDIGSALGLAAPDSPTDLQTVMDGFWNSAIETAFQKDDIKALQWIYGRDGLRGNGHYLSNDPPSSEFSYITTAEDTAYTFGTDSFTFVDDDDIEDSLQGIQIITLPTAGTLTLNNTAIKTNQIIHLADLNTGALKFIPAANAYGEDYATFTFLISDGINASEEAYDMSISVSSVIDHLNINGGKGNDSLIGDKIDTNTNDTLSGLSGNDTLMGKGGNDRLLGGDGNDILNGGMSNDILLGGNGSDWAYYSTEKSGISVNLSLTKAQNTLSAGFDTLIKIENLSGSHYNDKLIGNKSDNTLKGNNGQDVLIGATGKDTYILTEGVAATDTVRITLGDSSIKNFDKIIDFKLSATSTLLTAIDKLDLPSHHIAANIVRDDGKDAGDIQSHHINKGLISFDNVDRYAGAITIDKANFNSVINYLQANITDAGETVAFHSGGSTYVFQNQGTSDTLVQLIGDTAKGLTNTGHLLDGIWLT
ncbi:hypothetical protein [Crenothrix polyspora]|uniref:Uncharacterized protein n=1 Tax=Crenothrix polyspora TaxID=360316 RepID=A0A1R4HHZ5_9GAMM|nr:hypothetical protein [Crenothrix polyspora]SJM95819.1 hypothetical protein CRENPOLYSF1_80005 [Crenothrix polyspora]